MPSLRNTGEEQTSDHREEGSSNPSKDSSGVLKDIFTLMKEVVQTLTCIQKSTKEEIQKMTSVLCEETKLTHGLLENILKELQGQNLITYNRTYSIPDNKTLSEDCHYRDVGKKLAMCDPLEKYYRDGREFSTEQHSQNAESREVSATTVAVNQSLSENGAFESFQQSESILDSRETYGSHITDGVVNSLPTAQNNPLERGTGDSEKNIAEMSSPFPVSKNYIEVSGIRVKGGPDVDLQHLHDALARARLPDPLSSPRARSYDTVLCLDTSESMHEGGAFQQMVNIVNQFVDGVEDVVNESGSEENISVVTLEARPTLHSILPMIFLVSEMPLNVLKLVVVPLFMMHSLLH
ncbi:uncharacterized protein LOC112559027 isoform X2 [Pomacea canaliculata]|uniref:uncharacterized protein LOC112559027 isoform X2 n=1 Tax=Pomacea canaliculata TaxID=400727 RepID=UPI000D733C41|nr:uncharacterized protein LOC112559027 isoform X2 [Pomacea canaliculata]